MVLIITALDIQVSLKNQMEDSSTEREKLSSFMDAYENPIFRVHSHNGTSRLRRIFLGEK